jgi:UDP-2,3-diacylglucosamine hydrolase
LLFARKKAPQQPARRELPERRLGIIAGNSSFPSLFAAAARDAGYGVVAVCHTGETDPKIEQIADVVVWIKVGELGKIISTFKEFGAKEAAMAGGIDRIRVFGGVKLDARGMQLLARLRSTKDDIIMRGIADELESEGITVIECTRFMERHLAQEGVISTRQPTAEERTDIDVGISAVAAMSSQDIGQTVVVKDGVVVAVEAVEGTDRTIIRGGELGGPGTVVVKFAKTTQDLRFDVPTVGMKTLQTLVNAKAAVLAIEAERTLLLDKEDCVKYAAANGIAIVGCAPLKREDRGVIFNS